MDHDECQHEQHGPEQVVEERGGSATSCEEGEPPAVLQGKPGQPDAQRDEYGPNGIWQEKSGDDAQGASSHADGEGGSRGRTTSRDASDDVRRR